MNIINLLKKDEFSLIKKINLKPNETLFHEGESCQGAFFVKEGKIKIVAYSLQGEEERISTIGENEMFANALVFSNNSKYLGEVISCSNTIIYYFEKDILLNILQHNKDFLCAYINLISEKTIELTKRNKLLAHKNIRSRIIYFFEINNYQYKKNIAHIARQLILPRPSVSREINKMIEEGLIILKEKKLVLIQ